ncbi:hypothetical protein B0H12DRAFT_1153042, partial [Mycena haematopus]
MPCNQEGCHECEDAVQEESGGTGSHPTGRIKGGRKNTSQGGQRKRAKKAKAGWREDDDGGPPVTEAAGLLLSKLLAIFGRAHREKLDLVLAGVKEGGLPKMSADMASVVASINWLTDDIRVRELHLMLSLIQLALNVDSLRADNALKCLPKQHVTSKALAQKYAPGIHENTFRDWVNYGKKLLLLCAGGTLYLLPILAAMDLRTQITLHTLEEDILSLATALRCVKHGMWRPMVHQLMIPIFHMAALGGGYVEELRLYRNVPQPVGTLVPEVRTFGFKDFEISDLVFDGIQTNFAILQKRSSEWDSASVPAWKPLPDLHTHKLPPMFTLKTPLHYSKTPSPINKKTRNSFTEAQRQKAELAPSAENLDDLQARLNHLHADGKTKLGQYVKINSDILEGRALRIVDSNDKLLS